MKKMLEIGPFYKNGSTWRVAEHAITDHSYGCLNSRLSIPATICDAARKRLMPEIGLKGSYAIRFYKKRPRCKTIPLLFKQNGWKEADNPNRKWKPLGDLGEALNEHFELIYGEEHQLYVRVIEV